MTHGGTPAPTGEEALAKLRRFGGDRLARDLVGMFVDGLPERLADARAALAADDRDALVRLAHGLKSSCAQLGGAAAASAAAALESAGRAVAPGASLAHLSPALGGVERAATEYAAWLRTAIGRDDG